ncbi:MAG: hypothetical protein JHD23_10075 [Akkermansiaceae bacterium]|nr:hypothetical protein [Akkermansiaceae bacterium]
MPRKKEELRTGNSEQSWVPFLWIIAASALAHLWCLGSVFYLDDWSQIVNCEYFKTGRFWEAKKNAWSNLGYILEYQLFGLSPVGFHAVNWILHTSVACVLFGFGRDFLRDRWPVGVAWFAALLFSVHPLASEIPNYARTQDLAWVTLFSLLAAWAMFRFLRVGGYWRLAGCGVCMVGAMFSKGPGFFHALMMVGTVGLATMSSSQWKAVRQKAWILAVLFTVVVAAIFYTKFWGKLPDFSNPRLIGHAYTLARVFWEFAWRSIIPVALCSDHGVTETLIPVGGIFFPIPDTIAMIAMFALLLLAAISVYLAWRKSTRLFGVCLLLYVATILFRFFFLVPEFMPEYRIYPGLPWFCLGASILLATIWRFLFVSLSPIIPAIILLMVFAGLSASRSFIWHDTDRLTGDVLKRYPTRIRAVLELQARDAKAGHWQAIIDRHHQGWPELERQFVTENKRLAPAREIPSGEFVLEMIAIFSNYAYAVSQVESPDAGLRVLDKLEAHMKRLKMGREDRKNQGKYGSVFTLEWIYFYHTKAMVLESAGRFQDAIDTLIESECCGVSREMKEDLDRLTKKLAQVKPGL